MAAVLKGNRSGLKEIIMQRKRKPFPKESNIELSELIV